MHQITRASCFHGELFTSRVESKQWFEWQEIENTLFFPPLFAPSSFFCFSFHIHVHCEANLWAMQAGNERKKH